MSTCKVVSTSLAVSLLLCSAVSARLVSFEADVFASWNPTGVVISEGISSPAPAAIRMTAESHSSFTVIISAVNEMAFNWTGYLMMLNPAGSATFEPGSASSTKFTVVNYPDPHTIEFLAPNEVAPLEAVVFQFDIEIPGTGPSTFELTQQAIPEPATVAMLGLGAVALLLRRKGR